MILHGCRQRDRVKIHLISLVESISIRLVDTVYKKAPASSIVLKKFQRVLTSCFFCFTFSVVVFCRCNKITKLEAALLLHLSLTVASRLC